MAIFTITNTSNVNAYLASEANFVLNTEDGIYIIV